MREIIGLIGRKNSGKSTTAKYLCEEHGFIELSFAGPLKRFVQRVFNFNGIALYGPSPEREKVHPDEISDHERYWQWVDGRWRAIVADMFLYLDDAAYAKFAVLLDALEQGPSITARSVLQQVGTDWGRAVDENMWVKALLRDLDELDATEDTHNVVIADCRFPNEAQALRERGAELWWISRDKPEEYEIGHSYAKAGKSLAKEHASEPRGPEFIGLIDIEVVGTSVEGLHKSIETVLRTFRE